MECPICAETFNRSNHKMIKCHHCCFGACHGCVGRFLLEKDQAICMNCGGAWGYEFLSSQMTKVYMNKQYKEHIKTILMRDIRSGFGGHQEIATTANEKEKIWKQLVKTRHRLYVLEDQKKNHFEVHVVVNGHTYKLYHEINRNEVPENRYGSFLINYVEDLVNPPPNEMDKQMAMEEEKKLIQKINHLKFVYTSSILDRGFYITKKHYASISIRFYTTTLKEEDRQKYAVELQSVKEQLSGLEKQREQLYEKYMNEPDKMSGVFSDLIEQFYNLYRRFWKHYFLLYPASQAILQKTEEEKMYYTKIVDENCRNILLAKWEKEDVFHRFNSNKKYIYNLDDNKLYRLDGKEEHDDNVQMTLRGEEEKWHDLIIAHQEEMDRLLPLYEDLMDKHTILEKKLRMLNKRKTTSGNYIFSCPVEDCLGKLGDDGKCGLCLRIFCCACMKEKIENTHECLQDDKDTINELRKTTRPCPKCNVLIYKIEGCDQMWCVRCHTTFSWKTGAISNGVVHNPHFFHQRQNAMRTPGDIPCGGLPNEIEIVIAIANSPEDRANMYTIWDYCDYISERIMPRVYRKFNNTRPVKYRRYSIAYLRGKINDKRLGVLLFKNYMDEIRYSYYYSILETFIDNMADCMRRFVRGVNTENECIALLNLMEQDVARMNKVYNMNIKLKKLI